MPESRADRGQAVPRGSDGGTSVEAGMELAVELFECYHQDIFAYLYRMVREREWAQDLAQETFLRVLRARRRLPVVANPRAWLYRVATNVAAWAGVVAVAALLGLSLAITWRPLAEKAGPGVQPAW